MSKQFVEYYANFIQCADGWLAEIYFDENQRTVMCDAKTLYKLHSKVDKVIGKHAKENNIFALRTIRVVYWLDGRVDS